MASTTRAALLAVAITTLTTGALADSGHDHRVRDGTDLIAARKMFLDTCAGCHGARGEGTDETPVDFSTPEALLRLTPEVIGETLAREPHPALPEDDRSALAGYIRSYLMLPAPSSDTVLGRTIYSRDCSVCHGDRGDAASWAQNSLDPPPANFRAQDPEKLTREAMIDAVAFGRENTAMMAFAVQLGPEEIAATVDYIREAFMTGERMAEAEGGHDHGQDHAKGGTYPGGLTGDAEWGKAFYGANCAECHGDEGDGQGRRAYFMVIKPLNFLGREARARLDRSALYDGIAHGVNGTTMPAWQTVLPPQRIADVAEYVRGAFIEPTEDVKKN